MFSSIFPWFTSIICLTEFFRKPEPLPCSGPAPPCLSRRSARALAPRRRSWGRSEWSCGGRAATRGGALVGPIGGGPWGFLVQKCPKYDLHRSSDFNGILPNICRKAMECYLKSDESLPRKQRTYVRGNETPT